ncbi:MAG: 6-carboxytetrahydropterin synthase [Olsenella sp.]|jgi:6-pyruvoyltetrahydropterin/6-carboxytetrahydropterin synthase
MENNSLKYRRSYILKFYLNARHFLADGSYVGETHPHTWEFTLTIRISGLRFVRFNVFEEGIDACLAPYRNKLLNEEPPFDVVSPTLENLVEEFAKSFYAVIEKNGGSLVRVEGSESPARTYAVDIQPGQANGGPQDADIDRIVGDVVDEMLASDEGHAK